MSKRYKFLLVLLCLFGVLGITFALQNVLPGSSGELSTKAQSPATADERVTQSLLTDDSRNEQSTTASTSPAVNQPNSQASTRAQPTSASNKSQSTVQPLATATAAATPTNSIAAAPIETTIVAPQTTPAQATTPSTTLLLPPTTSIPTTTVAASSTTAPRTTATPTTTSAPTTTIPPITAAPTTAAPAQSCGAYWGAYVDSFERYRSYDAANRLKAINDVENQMGRKFDIDHQFYRWDDFVSNHNISNYIKPSIAQGRKPFLSWKPVYRDNTNIAWADITNGDHDALIRQKAKQVKSIGSPIILVFGHEADSRVGTFQPGKVTPVDGHIKADAGSAAEFAAAYRHVHDVFAQEGVTNVDWAWIMTRAPFEANAGARSADLLYPGDSYVDIIGLDPYNFFFNNKWREMKDLMGGFTNWNTTRNKTKPWMIAEWGSVEDPNQPGRKAQWLRNAADYYESEARIKYIIHFDSFPTYNWLYDSSDSSAKAWKEISTRDYFNCPLGTDIPDELAFTDPAATNTAHSSSRYLVPLIAVALLAVAALFILRITRRTNHETPT